jgi:hypothetical protein
MKNFENSNSESGNTYACTNWVFTEDGIVRVK